MLPVLLLLGIRTRRRIWLPLPTILIWPLWLLGWPLWFVLWILRTPWERPLRTALVLPMHLSGLRVDVETADGEHIHLRVI